jgi:hypothetical protein
MIARWHRAFHGARPWLATLALGPLVACASAPPAMPSEASVPPYTSAVALSSAPASEPSAGAAPSSGVPSATPATSTSPPRTASKDECIAALRAGAKLHDAGQYDEAIRAYRAGFDRCGNGFGFAGEIGYSLSKKGDFDKAVDEFLLEITSPGPKPTAFGNLAALIPKLSAERIRVVRGIGVDPARPIFVADIGDEYFWAEKIACGRAAGKVDSQALVSNDGQELDRLDYHCADGSKHQAFFDFSADPNEQAMKKELGN